MPGPDLTDVTHVTSWLPKIFARKVSRTADVLELLGRKPVNLDTPEIQRFIAGKRVMVTGAGGSIGSEICRQIARFCPQRLLLVERAENALFEIDRELRSRWIGVQIDPLVADIGDEARIDQIFEQYAPQVIFHCAAHKHVPMMEANPGEAIKNNVLGTKCVADAALKHGAAAFVMVSTDKAVNPTSVMGAAKRCAELYIQSLNQPGVRVQGSGEANSLILNPEPRTLNPQTRFVAVRFGNVLGSSGSVVPIFRKQIEAGGPVTVTDAQMQRYFMTIPEAAQLVMQAGAIGQGGEIFVLDMGQPVKIVDLAREMIRRSGLREGKDIFIEFTGVRPGEKLFEELAAHNEQTRPTSHPKIFVWQLPTASAREVDIMLKLLQNSMDGGRATAVSALRQVVPEYQPPEGEQRMRVVSAAA